MNDIPDPLAAAVAMAPFVAGLLEGARRSGLAERWAMPAALGLGLLIAVLFAAAGWADMDLGNWATVVLMGVAAGLSAVGLYEGARTITGRAHGSEVTVADSGPERGV